MTKTKRTRVFSQNLDLSKTLIIDSQFPNQKPDHPSSMDFHIAGATATTPSAATITTPDTDTEHPTSELPKSSDYFRSLSFTNGATLKPHHHYPRVAHTPPQTVVVYKECLKNHAASLGSYAVDGCGEFFPCPMSNPADPTSLKCAACGCHRNFHRRHAPADDHNIALSAPPTRGQQQRHLLLPPPAHSTPSPSRSSPSRSTSPGPTLSQHSPPPVSQAPPVFFGSPTEMLLALSSAAYTGPVEQRPGSNLAADKSTSGKKRSRTRFSQAQKDKMLMLAEKLGWRMQKSEDKFVEDLCDEVGIEKRVFKVWMHNNKYQHKKRPGLPSSSAGVGVDGIANLFESNAEINTNNINNNNVVNNEGSRSAGFYHSNNGSSSSS